MGGMKIKVFEFKLFQKYPGLIHGVFSRSGGVSRGCFDSLNIGLSTGDDPLAVAKNRNRILERVESQRAVFLNQVHGKNIHVVEKNVVEKDVVGRENEHVPIVADGVVTNSIGTSLVIQVADCQGVLLFDPEKKVIANVHSGWKGSIQNIIGNCIDVMINRFECNPLDILAGISPSLGPCCSEFINYKDEIPESLWAYKLPEKPYFDFWKISRDQMGAKGIKMENIETMNLCTRCNSDQFYSYRRENKTGRFACVIGLKN
jgi:YfiH family protein